MLDDVEIDREGCEDDPTDEDAMEASEHLTINCGVTKVKGIPVWTEGETEEDEGGKGKKGKDKKDKGKKGKDKGKNSTPSLAPEPVLTNRCWLQVTLKGVQHDFKEGENDDIRISDTPSVAWGPALWSGDPEEEEDGKPPGSAKGGKDKKKKDKGKGAAEPVEEPPPPPPKGTMELKFKPTPDVRDAIMFGGLELVLWRVSEEEKYELVEEEEADEEKKEEGEEKEGKEEKKEREPEPTQTTSVSKDKLGRVMSTSISTSTITRQESGVTMRKDETKTTVEVARGTVDLNHFLKQSSLNKFGEGKLELKGVLTLCDGFVQVEKDRINGKIKERKMKEKEEEAEDAAPVEGEEEKEVEEEPNWQPEDVGVVEFDVEINWNERAKKQPEVAKADEEEAES